MFGALARALGPIFAADFVALGRRPRNWALRIAIAAATLGVFVAAFRGLPARSGPGSIRVLSGQAETIADGVLLAQWLAAWFVGPGLVLGGLAGDRRRGEREVLFTTALSNREIVVGTVGARLLAAALLLAVPMPCLAILATLGGVSLEVLARSQTEVLVALAFSAGVALFFATRRRTIVEAAALTALACVTAAFVVPAVATWYLRTRVPGFPGPAFWRLRYFCPGFDAVLEWQVGRRGPFGMQLRQVVANTMAIMDGTWHQAIAWCCQAAMLPAGALFAILTLRRTKTPRPASAVTKALQRMQAPRKPVSNPWWQRARVARAQGRVGFARTLALLFAFAVILATVAQASLFRQGVPEASALLIASIGLWLAGGATIVALATLGPMGDRQRGFLGDALMTELTVRQHFDGMQLAACDAGRLPALGLAVAFAVRFLLDPSALQYPEPLRFILKMALLAGLGSTCLAGAVACAWAARTEAQALAGSLLFASLALTGWCLPVLIDPHFVGAGNLLEPLAVCRHFPLFPLLLLFAALAIVWGALGQTFAPAALALVALAALVFLLVQIVAPGVAPITLLFGLAAPNRIGSPSPIVRSAIFDNVLWHAAALFALALLVRELAVRRFERLLRRPA